MKGMESTQRSLPEWECTAPATNFSVSKVPLASSHISRLMALGRPVVVLRLTTNADNRGVSVNFDMSFICN
jgi:hypothetical protein